MKNKRVEKLFGNKKVGRSSFRGLKNKETKQPLTDLEYFELLGRKAIKMDEENPNKNIPTDYKGLNRDVVNVAKTICQAIDEGMSKTELTNYLQTCIEIEEN